MVRVFVKKEQIAGGRLRLDGGDAHHIRDVLRMRTGDTVLASDGEWEYVCRIAGADADGVLLAVTDAQKPGHELPSRVTLLQCLPKGDKMETVIQKAAELGAAEIVPVASSRCVVKLDEKRAKAKVQRWNAIARSAAEQSKRMEIPEVLDVLPFSGALSYAAGLCGADPGVEDAPERSSPEPCLLIPYERASGMAETRRILGAIRPGQPVAVLIGPEGGFSGEEVREAEAAGFRAVTLGGRILRTETAGMAVLAVLAYLLEE